MSRRRYWVRRAVALAVVIAIVAVPVWAVSSWLRGGGDGTPTAQASPPASDPGASTVPSATAATAGATTPTTEPGPAGPPTAESPATLYIAGDSDAGAFGPYLEQLMDQTGVVDTTLDYKVSSGLTRPDFYDWPGRLREQMAAVDPDLVVVTFGGNDAQPMDGHGVNVGTEEWAAEYRARVGEVVDILTEGGRKLVWVGIPNAASADFTGRLQAQRDAVVAELAEHPEVTYIDTWARFSGRNGGYAEFVIDPRDGQGKDVRAADGFHLNTTGAEILGLDIAEALRAELRTRGAQV